MKKTLDYHLKAIGYVSVFLILSISVFLFVRLSIKSELKENRSGLVSYVVLKNNIYNFKLKGDSTLYCSTLYLNNDFVSKFIYKWMTPYQNIYEQNNIIKLQDTISFVKEKNDSYSYLLSQQDRNFFSNINDGIIIRKVSNSKIKNVHFESVNNLQIGNSKSNYLFSKQASLLLNVLYMSLITLSVIIVLFWVLYLTDTKGLKYKEEETNRINNLILKLEYQKKKLAMYIGATRIDIPNNLVDDFRNLADLYWITNKSSSRAEKLYKAILKGYPNDVHTLIMYGEFLLGENRYIEYEQIIKRALELDPEVRSIVQTNKKYLKILSKENYNINIQNEPPPPFLPH